MGPEYPIHGSSRVWVRAISRTNPDLAPVSSCSIRCLVLQIWHQFWKGIPGISCFFKMASLGRKRIRMQMDRQYSWLSILRVAVIFAVDWGWSFPHLALSSHRESCILHASQTQSIAGSQRHYSYLTCWFRMHPRWTSMLARSNCPSGKQAPVLKSCTRSCQ